MKSDSKRLVGQIVWVISIVLLLASGIPSFVLPYDQINHIITNGLMPITAVVLMIAGFFLIFTNPKTKQNPPQKTPLPS
jgi:hypothetical protein